MPKYPDIHVCLDLKGPSGNAFVIMHRVTRALKKAGVPDDEIQAYHSSAMSGDYQNLLRVTEEIVSFNQ